ncbi:hypothetical protein AX769_15870 [Frondihabitans sp. PAMC 28766]|uniref:hypothetical protein n=1 Tax=Frondihabitans sp. PAMC 28766 TaxID=1795630 RepID=UPI00078E30CA|nr:hypothetical protein [Frondihabitans sp. PAMC 28766]AMM21336.1 hypothetical protein AX769_15870 [Frondihabitans sp. PAMC 28766]
MNDFLDAAAIRSARALKAVGRTSFGGRVRERAAIVRENVAVVRAVAETVREMAEPRIQQHLSAAGQSGAAERMAAVAAGGAPGAVVAPANHGPLAPAPDGSLEPGDDERCTCSGTGDAWCGATRRDVVHDLTTRGAQLSREQALHIWATAQAARAV